MSKAKTPKKVKLVCGFIYPDPAVYAKAKAVLAAKFGKIDLESHEMDFKHTDYYAGEMGSGLKKRLISFEKLVAPDRLSGIKKFTNGVEGKFTDKRTGSRRINIDPGILNLSRLILASAKDFAHRIYLKDGIFAEVTLRYQDKRFTTLPWTYPDFATDEYTEILQRIRAIYEKQQ